ncbi:MAG: hypothetical protein O7F12_17350 [Nitrospirae bacterium]|nr:hypothetical protein [Nitrospirota bacterium]
MARIILGSYMVRYPLGGMMSWVLQYLIGFQKLGHDVYFVEKSGYPNSCYDPTKKIMTDDCTYGITTLHSLLKDFDLQHKWCFVDGSGRYHGLSQNAVETTFESADLFVDMGTHGSWEKEAEQSELRVLIDGEPGFTQINMENRLKTGEPLPQYDFYYTAGANIGKVNTTAPTAGKQWKHLYHPVVVDLFDTQPVSPSAPFSTVMNWQSHQPIEFNGIKYGQKDLEFVKFMDLPTKVTVPMEVAVSGKNVPVTQLKELGWSIRDAQEVTLSFDSFREYVSTSKGEFSVCKNVFVATYSGWFSDRSATYLASGRPVILQETGFSDYLPCGHGLFAIRTVEEAATAIIEINADYDRHSRWARDLALEYMDASKVLKQFLTELGI